DDFGGLLGLFGIDVAQRNDIDIGDLDEAEQVVLAVPATADQPDARFFRLLRGAEVDARGGDGQAGGAGVKEVAAVHEVPPDEGRVGQPQCTYAETARRGAAGPLLRGGVVAASVFNPGFWPPAGGPRRRLPR